jgi:hypothetical protein
MVFVVRAKSLISLLQHSVHALLCIISIRIRKGLASGPPGLNSPVLSKVFNHSRQLKLVTCSKLIIWGLKYRTWNYLEP